MSQSGVSRRGFLKGSAGAAAGTAALIGMQGTSAGAANESADDSSDAGSRVTGRIAAIDAAEPDGATPGPGGWNRIHFVTTDFDAEIARLRDAGVRFRNDVVSGPGGRQILVLDPSGNVIELFEPAGS